MSRRERPGPTSAQVMTRYQVLNTRASSTAWREVRETAARASGRALRLARALRADPIGDPRRATTMTAGRIPRRILRDPQFDRDSGSRRVMDCSTSSSSTAARDVRVGPTDCGSRDTRSVAGRGIMDRRRAGFGRRPCLTATSTSRCSCRGRSARGISRCCESCSPRRA